MEGIRHYCFLLLLFILFVIKGYAQDIPCRYNIEGAIYDLTTNEPLPFATIRLLGTSKGTVADVNGYFYLNSICEEEFDIEVSHIGYKKVIHHHDVHHKLPKIFLAPDNVTLQSVIIEGEVQPGDMLTGTVSAISSDQLVQYQDENFGDIVGRIAGVSVIKSGQNIVKPVIHGLHSNRILIINNGVRHEFQNWGQEHAPEIDPSMADNIQVVKGAATVRYGPDALGGVIVLNPARMEFLDPLNGNIGGAFASNGRSGEGNFMVRKGFHKVALIAEGSYQKQGDLKAPDYYLTNTGKEELSLGFGVKYHHKNIDITARYSRFDQELGILRGSVTGNLNDLVRAMENEVPAGTRDFSYSINNPRQLVRHDMIKINTEISEENSIFSIQYAYQNNHRREFDVRRGTNNELPSIDLQMATHTIDVDWKHPNVKGWMGTIGSQALYQDNNNVFGTNTIPFIPNFNNYRIGVFLIESKELSTVTLEWGLRYDYQYSSIRSSQPRYHGEPQFQNLTATAGIRKNFDNNNYFISNVGSAWRPPSISELYAFGKHQNAIEYGLQRYYFDDSSQIKADGILNENEKPLKSEKGLKWINTYHFETDNVEAEITSFLNYIENYIYTKPGGITSTTRGAFPYFLYDQTTALLTGADLSMIVRHNNKFESALNASYLWARDIKNEDYFVSMPPVNVRYSLNYNRKNWLSFSNSTIGMDLEYSSAPLNTIRTIPINDILEAKAEGRELFQESDKAFDFVAPPPGYFLADIFWAGELKKWSIILKVKNVLNTRYRTYTNRMRYFADDVGRSLNLSVKYSF